VLSEGEKQNRNNDELDYDVVAMTLRRLITLIFLLVITVMMGLTGWNLQSVSSQLSAPRDIWYVTGLPNNADGTTAAFFNTNMTRVTDMRHDSENGLPSLKNVSRVFTSPPSLVGPRISRRKRRRRKIWVVLHGVKGRLGNYMMQFSAGLGVVRRIKLSNVELCLSPRTKQLRSTLHSYFNGPFPQVCPGSIQRGVLRHDQDWSEANDTYKDDFVDQAHNCTARVCFFRMVGFWSSYKYFEHIQDEIKSTWKLTQPYLENTQKVLFSGPNSTVNIGIHIRRGDMMNVTSYQLPNMDYFYRAMDYYRLKYNRTTRFLIASDDKDWCQDNFGNLSDTTILPQFLPPAVELGLLSQTNHVITSAGTFGWWAAFLSGRQAIYPKRAYESEYWTPTRLENHLPPEWIGL
jgi:hypothetical protein